MTLTRKNLVWERPHTVLVGARHRVYRFSGGHGLSLVTGQPLHYSPFAWEAAVLENVSEDGRTFNLDYSTELTCGGEVFRSDAEANAFIRRAARLFNGEKKS